MIYSLKLLIIIEKFESDLRSHSSGLIHTVQWYFLTIVSEHLISTNFRIKNPYWPELQRSRIQEDVSDKLSRRDDMKLPRHAA